MCLFDCRTHHKSHPITITRPMEQLISRPGYCIVRFRVVNHKLCVHTDPPTNSAINSPNYQCIVNAAKTASDILDWDDQFVHRVDCIKHTATVVKWYKRSAQPYLESRIPPHTPHRDFVMNLFTDVIARTCEWID